MDRRHILLGPLMVWLALMALGAASLLYALLPALPAKPAIAIAIVMAQAATILVLFMNLTRSSALVRLSALGAIVWLGFLFLMSFADLLTR